MKPLIKTVISWVALGLCLILSAGLIVGAVIKDNYVKRGKTYEISAKISEGDTIYTPATDWGYRYGPTMMYNEAGTLQAWFSTPPEGGQYSPAWDVLTFRETSDYGKNWTDEYVSVAPLANSEEMLSVCDPGVIYMNGYYYMFYTSTIELLGRYNNVYCARSVSPDGTWERWNGNGWGGNESVPVVVYGSQYEHYGIGEPSVVIVGDKLYIYYTYKGPLTNGQVVNQTRLTIADAVENFPLTMKEYGVVIGGKAADEDSLDVKYIDGYDIFIGITTDKRMSYRSRIKMYYSYDGKNFREAEVDDASAKAYLHNIGITGDGRGHIDLSKPQFVAYAYGDGGLNWGRWNTEFQQITFTVKEVFDKDKADGTRLTPEPDFADGVVPYAWGLSEASEYRSALEALDGDPLTFYSSIAHSIASPLSKWHDGMHFHEMLAITSQKKSAKAMVITPRTNGDDVYGFPKAFKIQSSNDGVLWTTISEYSDYTPKNGDPITFSFGKTVKAKFFRIYATELGADEFDAYILQIAEIALK